MLALVGIRAGDVGRRIVADHEDGVERCGVGPVDFAVQLAQNVLAVLIGCERRLPNRLSV
jgi:hypothetical protein